MRCPNPVRIGAAAAAGASFLFEPPHVISIVPSSPRLLDRVRLELRTRHYSPKTEAARQFMNAS